MCEKIKQLNAPCLSTKFKTKKTAEYQPFLMLLKLIFIPCNIGSVKNLVGFVTTGFA